MGHDTTMSTALLASSLTLQQLLSSHFEADPNFVTLFGGGIAISLNTPQEMLESGQAGLSLWLYRIDRDGQTLNRPPVRVGFNSLRPAPLPLCLHYLMTPIVQTPVGETSGPESEQLILGKVLQCFHDQSILWGTHLQGDFIGQDLELHVRLEPLGLEEITRVWDALERSYQLCISYQVSVVPIESGREELQVNPVDVAIPEVGVIVGSE